MASSIHYQLWMGDLEPYMTESFIMAAFRKMREDPKFVRVIRHRRTGTNAGYCFINFATDRVAWNAMYKLNGKPIPDTKPTVLFRLNVASSSSKNQNNRKFSLWVGDLSSDVDDYQLFRTFSSKYASVKGAKVILDLFGSSKGYGFVHFGNEEDERSALREMNGYYGLGGKPLKIRNAISKYENTNYNHAYNHNADYNTSYAIDYQHYYTNTWQQPYNNWANYYNSSTNYTGTPLTYGTGSYYHNDDGMNHFDMGYATSQQFHQSFNIDTLSHIVPIHEEKLHSSNGKNTNNKKHYDLQQYKNQVSFNDYIGAKGNAEP